MLKVITNKICRINENEEWKFWLHIRIMIKNFTVDFDSQQEQRKLMFLLLSLCIRCSKIIVFSYSQLSKCPAPADVNAAKLRTILAHVLSPIRWKLEKKLPPQLAHHMCIPVCINLYACVCVGVSQIIKYLIQEPLKNLK